MNSLRRRRYLDALGIEAWSQRREATAAVSVEVHDTAPLTPAPMPQPETSEVTSAHGSGFRPPIPGNEPLVGTAASHFEAPREWPALQQAVSACSRCKLCRTRNKTVFGVGDTAASLMVVGEGPGADEDAQGEPFVGRAGRLLDEMLKAIGRSRTSPAPEQSVFIANVVKCRPPANRDPEAEEVEACRPYLDRQIEHIAPKLIVALGRIAAQRLLATDAPLSKLRGELHAYGELRTPVLVTYHPAYLLRSPGEKAKSWADLKRVHRFLAG